MGDVLSEQVDALERDAIRLGSRNRSLTTRLDECKAERDRLAAELAQAKSDLNDMHAQWGSDVEELGQLRGELAYAQESVAELETWRSTAIKNAQATGSAELKLGRERVQNAALNATNRELRDRLAAELAQERAKVARLRDVLKWIASHSEGDDEPGDRNPRHHGWEMSQRASAALAEPDPCPWCEEGVCGPSCGYYSQRQTKLGIGPSEPDEAAAAMLAVVEAAVSYASVLRGIYLAGSPSQGSFERSLLDAVAAYIKATGGDHA